MWYVTKKGVIMRLRTLIIVVFILLIVAGTVYWLARPTDDSNSYWLVDSTDDPNSCGDAPCCLTTVEDYDESVFRKHYSNAINYYMKYEFKEARDEFRQALTLDINFPGLNQWIADSSLKLKEYNEAEAALKKEFELLDCLDSMTDDELIIHATSKGMNEINVLEMIVKARAESLYNLACVYSAKKERQLALGTLQEAIKAGFNEKDATCPELEIVYN